MGEEPVTSRGCIIAGCKLDHAGAYHLCPEHLHALVSLCRPEAQPLRTTGCHDGEHNCAICLADGHALGKAAPLWQDYEIDTDDVCTLDGFDGVCLMTGEVRVETGLRMSRETARTLAKRLDEILRREPACRPMVVETVKTLAEVAAIEQRRERATPGNPAKGKDST